MEIGTPCKKCQGMTKRLVCKEMGRAEDYCESCDISTDQAGVVHEGKKGKEVVH